MNRRRSFLVLAATAAFVLAPACAPDSGGRRIRFSGSVARVGDAAFENDRGWAVTLDQAVLTFGPVYLGTYVRPTSTGRLWNLVRPRVAHAHDEGYVGDGRVVGQLLSRISVDLAKTSSAAFPDLGDGLEDDVGSVDLAFWPPPPYSPEAAKSPDAALTVVGTAEKGGATVRFRGALYLDDAWITQSEPGSPGRQTLTDIRTVSGVSARLRLRDGGALTLGVDLAALFRGAEFSNLADSPEDPLDPGRKVLVQGSASGTDQVMRSLYTNLRSSRGTYVVTFSGGD